MFVPGKLFQASMFAGKARAYPSETLERKVIGLTHKHYTLPERFSKHPSLLQKFVNCGQKSFVTLVTGNSCTRDKILEKFVDSLIMFSLFRVISCCNEIS